MNLQVKLEFVDCITEFGEVSLAAAPDNIDGLIVDVFEDEFISDGSSKSEYTGLKQVHIAGTPDALMALGAFLIAISKTTPPRDFITHLEPIKGSKGVAATHLVIHHSAVDGFDRTIRIGSSSEADE